MSTRYTRLAPTTVVLLISLNSLATSPARAHHGTAAVAGIAVEGPGAALDTTSPLPLGQGTAFALAKSEYARFQQRAGFDEQKQYSLFNTVALGFGITPWLSAFVFQPYNWKSQAEVGTNSGFGDTNLMLSLSLKWDEGPRFTPEKESLDELEDWHLGVWTSCSIPVGATSNLDDSREHFAPDMQTGFRGPSPAIGVALMKQLSPAFTLLGEASAQTFFTQRYPDAGYTYRFGTETRVNAALVAQLGSWTGGRIDLVPELSMLNLQRDKEDGVALEASGGTILYGQVGARVTLGSLSIGASAKRAVVKSLNEAPDQQGSEGLEDLRVALVLGYAAQL